MLAAIISACLYFSRYLMFFALQKVKKHCLVNTSTSTTCCSSYSVVPQMVFDYHLLNICYTCQVLFQVLEIKISKKFSLYFKS